LEVGQLLAKVGARIGLMVKAVLVYMWINEQSLTVNKSVKVQACQTKKFSETAFLSFFFSFLRLAALTLASQLLEALVMTTRPKKC
jgi:hypothetical protein